MNFKACRVGLPDTFYETDAQPTVLRRHCI